MAVPECHMARPGQWEASQRQEAGRRGLGDFLPIPFRWGPLLPGAGSLLDLVPAGISPPYLPSSLDSNSKASCSHPVADGYSGFLKCPPSSGRSLPSCHESSLTSIFCVEFPSGTLLNFSAQGHLPKHLGLRFWSHPLAPPQWAGRKFRKSQQGSADGQAVDSH